MNTHKGVLTLAHFGFLHKKTFKCDPGPRGETFRLKPSLRADLYDPTQQKTSF